MTALRKRIKKKDHEILTDSNIAHVISLLDQTKPITKKQACEILNISYNTSRLNTIIENWKDTQEHKARRKAENKGKPASATEILDIIQSYLEGDNISEISKALYRSATFVKNVVEKVGIPTRVIGEDKGSISVLPEQCISEDFIPGEIAWSAQYHGPCVIKKLLDETKYKQLYDTKCYTIYIMESVDEPSPYFPHIVRGGYFAHSPSYDLGKLDHLMKYGLVTEKI